MLPQPIGKDNADDRENRDNQMSRLVGAERRENVAQCQDRVDEAAVETMVAFVDDRTIREARCVPVDEILTVGVSVLFVDGDTVVAKRHNDQNRKQGESDGRRGLPQIAFTRRAHCEALRTRKYAFSRSHDTLSIGRSPLKGTLET